jgi:hypothetical protein
LTSPTPPLVGPCEPWTPIWCVPLPTGSAPVSGYAVQAATDALYQASAQRFGLCTITVRPCRRTCAEQYGTSPWEGRYPRPAHTDRGWINVTCASCSDSCSCSQLEETLLPGPVYDVTEVKIDGTPLPTTSYRLDNHRLLVRTDGGRWPLCQYLDRADTQPGTWSVTARFGEPVPALGQMAVAELAADIAAACLGQECRLPKNIASLARQGVSLNFMQSRMLTQQIVERGYFGALFVETFNPRRLTGRPQVFDIDGVSRVRTTGT